MTNQLFKNLFSYICGKKVVFVCIGSDLVGGDCLGPLVGQLLIEANIPAFVYGTLLNPVNALNVNSVGEFILKQHPNAVVVAIDSAVGNDIGQININKCAMLPGLADGKSLNAIGDVSITAVTCNSPPGKKEFSLVRLGFVYHIAKKLSRLLCDCILHSTYFESSNQNYVSTTSLLR